jgi:hypothetical protein
MVDDIRSRALDAPVLSERVTLGLDRLIDGGPVCRLSVRVGPEQSIARLVCHDGPGFVGPWPARTAEQKLPATEGSRILALAHQAALFAGGHLGLDGRAHDAMLETLTVHAPGDVSAVLLVTGNPTFSFGSPRKQLLAALRLIWSGMESQVRRQPGDR